jgi:hypothetical protein
MAGKRAETAVIARSGAADADGWLESWLLLRANGYNVYELHSNLDLLSLFLFHR